MQYLDKTGLTYFWSKIKTELGKKQATLVSGTNIKTVNGNSLLGNGNINTSSLGGGLAGIDTSNVLATLTKDTVLNYTATEDCWVFFYISHDSSSENKVYIDDVLVDGVNGNIKQLAVKQPLKKGQTIRTSGKIQAAASLSPNCVYGVK